MSTDMQKLAVTLIEAVQSTQGIEPRQDSVLLQKCLSCGSYSCREMGCFYDVDETGE